MLLQIRQVLDAGQVNRCRELLATAEWTDGRVTAGSGRTGKEQPPAA